MAVFQENIFYKNKQWSILTPQSAVCWSLFYTNQRKTPVTHLPQIQHPDAWEKITKWFFLKQETVCLKWHFAQDLEEGRLGETTSLHSQGWCGAPGAGCGPCMWLLICWLTLLVCDGGWAPSFSSTCQTSSFSCSESWPGLCAALWRRKSAPSAEVHLHQWPGGGERPMQVPLCPQRMQLALWVGPVHPALPTLHYLSFPAVSPANFRPSCKCRNTALRGLFNQLPQLHRGKLLESTAYFRSVPVILFFSSIPNWCVIPT